MNENNKCQIITPFFNEENNFIEFTNRLEGIDSNKFSFIFIDNGSSLKSLEEILIENQISKNKLWKIVRTDKNLGYGGGIMFGLQSVEASHVSWMPGNLKVDPINLLNYLENIELKDNEFIKFKRIHRRPIAKIKTLIFGIITSIIFGKLVNDVGGVPCVSSTENLRKIKYSPNNFLFDVFIYLYYKKLKKIKILRPKIPYTERLHGTSHWQVSWFAEAKLILDMIKAKKIWKMYI
jgi:hypothetical protein